MGATQLYGISKSEVLFSLEFPGVNGKIMLVNQFLRENLIPLGWCNLYIDRFWLGPR